MSGVLLFNTSISKLLTPFLNPNIVFNLFTISTRSLANFSFLPNPFNKLHNLVLYNYAKNGTHDRIA